MAARARLIGGYDIPAACARVTAPTLIVTGEPDLDFVVKTDTTRQYTTLIPGSQHRVLEDTGHQGTLTRPGAFAEVVRRFAEKAHHAAA
jgi:pimeloyl-ACP methyl ester carboxylesterase